MTYFPSTDSKSYFVREVHDLSRVLESRRLSSEQRTAAEAICPKLLKYADKADTLDTQALRDRKIQDLLRKKLGMNTSGPDRSFNNIIIHKLGGGVPGHPDINSMAKGSAKLYYKRIGKPRKS